jgi:hypothetical protein
MVSGMVKVTISEAQIANKEQWALQVWVTGHLLLAAWGLRGASASHWASQGSITS